MNSTVYLFLILHIYLPQFRYSMTDQSVNHLKHPIRIKANFLRNSDCVESTNCFKISLMKIFEVELNEIYIELDF